MSDTFYGIIIGIVGVALISLFGNVCWGQGYDQGQKDYRQGYTRFGPNYVTDGSGHHI